VQESGSSDRKERRQVARHGFRARISLYARRATLRVRFCMSALLFLFMFTMSTPVSERKVLTYWTEHGPRSHNQTDEQTTSLAPYTVEVTLHSLAMLIISHLISTKKRFLF
jgi:hypothetical protein